MKCVVLTLKDKPRRLEQFQRRWDRVSTLPIEPFYAVEDPDPAVSCYESHLQILAGSSDAVAVFEDDAIFMPTFTLDGIPPRVLVYLGGQHLEPPTPLAPGWVTPTRIARSHAYIANMPTLLLPGLLERVHRHIDTALNAQPVTKAARALFQVGQAAGVSTITGQNNANRFWND